MRLVYKTIQVSLRKVIDLLMSCWLWANKHEKQATERKRYGR